MAMITVHYTSFFKELAKNNHKEWFHANKKRYESDVKEPFLELVGSLLPSLRDWDDRIPHDARKALFRIHKDVRFSKDKSPYHLIMKAGFSPMGKKSKYPGYYLGIDSERIHLGGGLFMIQPPELKKVRAHLAANPDEFTKIIGGKGFQDVLGGLQGERSKRLDKDLIPAAEQNPHIYNKQFYAMAKAPLEAYYDSDRLPEFILGFFKEIRPLNEFLNKAIL